MNKIIALCDYKGRVGSKYDSVPYRSGFDKIRLKEIFNKYGYSIEYISTSDAITRSFKPDEICIYTSTEDWEGLYKIFLEDIVFYIENSGVKVIPQYEFLRAHNNKVSMELLRYKYGSKWNDKLKSSVYGTKAEVVNLLNNIKFPAVFKSSAGAMSRGVYLAHNHKQAIKYISKISKSDNKLSYRNIKEILRTIKHKGYIKECLNRKKFILQPFVENLKNDWKILLYGDILFVLSRGVKKGDFRASGSHHNYLAGSKATVPRGLFDFAFSVKNALDVPHLSLDVVYNDNTFYLIEFQAVYFGTSTINMSDVYYEKIEDEWIPKDNNLSVEELYVYGIHHYLINR